MVDSLTIIPYPQFLIHSIILEYFLQKLPDMIYGIFRKTEISQLKEKWYHVRRLMPKSSFEHLYWIENQCLGECVLEKSQKTTNIHHIMSVYCGLLKIFCISSNLLQLEDKLYWIFCQSEKKRESIEGPQS